MKRFLRTLSLVGPITIAGAAGLGPGFLPEALGRGSYTAQAAAPQSSTARQPSPVRAESPEYQQTQARLAEGWNTWDVHSVTTQVLLPEGLAVHIGLKHNSTLWGESFLSDALIGRQGPGQNRLSRGRMRGTAAIPISVFSGRVTRSAFRAHTMDGIWCFLLPRFRRPLNRQFPPTLPPTILVSINFLWNRPGTVLREKDHMEAHGPRRTVPIYCTCGRRRPSIVDLPTAGPYFALDFTAPVGISSGKSRTLAEIQEALGRQKRAYDSSIAATGEAAPIADAIQTTLGWDTIYEPEGRRVVSPVSRVWSVAWGGYVIFDWDNLFAATMAAIGDRDLAYANAIETLRGSTGQGFVPNYARARGWKSSDRSEPPVGAITVLGLYQKFGDRWLLRDTFQPLLRWNRWWSEHRDIQGYLTWGSDGENEPANLDDGSRGTRAGAILESGLDNSPMYDDATYNHQTHRLEWADVGLISLYIADCDALATMAAYSDDRLKRKNFTSGVLATGRNWLRSGTKAQAFFSTRTCIPGSSALACLPPTFIPWLAKAATPAQADRIIEGHLLNPQEFWGEWVIPAIARNDPAFVDQQYWRGRIWGPMNYLVYLGLRNYDVPEVRAEFAQKSYKLFLKEWQGNGHVHENYNAMTGVGDDVTSSDRFYHWGALLGFIEYLEHSTPSSATATNGKPLHGSR